MIRQLIITHIVIYILEATKGAQGMGVVSDKWFDRVLLPILYMFRPPHVDRCSDPPSLGPP